MYIIHHYSSNVDHYSKIYMYINMKDVSTLGSKAKIWQKHAGLKSSTGETCPAQM